VSRKDLPESEIRLREAIAVFLYGKGYTDEQLKAVGITGPGKWYRYPDSGTYQRVGNVITVRQDGKADVSFL
jgi:hypothetical protein